MNIRKLVHGLLTLSVAVSLLLAISSLHIFYRPLDTLWFLVARKLGI